MIRALLLISFFFTVSASLSVAQSDPTLKRATPFTVLAATEIINNAVETGVTGNVGVHPGSTIIGEERLVILQGRAEKGTAAAAVAMEDANAAYNSLSTLKSRARQLSPIIGTGTVLTPGAYRIDGGLTLQGVLTLDGLGNEDDPFFIFVDGNLLSESSNAGVITQGRAHIKNLYWIVSGEVNLGSISGMKGNILAKQDIKLNGVVVEGRVISLEGKVVFNGERNNLYLPANLYPDLNVTKTAPTKEYRIGDQITYTIVVNNAGLGSATDVVVTENFPAGLQYVPGSVVSSGGEFNESNYTWSIGFLQFGQSHELKLTFTIVNAGTLQNIVSVASENTEKEETKEDNRDEEEIVVPEISSNLNVTKEASGVQPYVLGSEVTYTIRVNNAGPYNAKDVSLMELLPAELEYVSALVSQGQYNPATGLCTIGDLAVGASATLTIVARIVAPGSVANTVTVSVPARVDVPQDNSPEDNTAVEVIEVVCEPITAIELTTVSDLSYLCEGTNGTVFTATEVIGATYKFTLTGGLTMAGGLTEVTQAGNSISVNAGATSGTVEVTVTDLCGKSLTAKKEIDVVNSLATPNIVGLDKVCQNSTDNTYSVEGFGDDAEYTWIATGGVEITAGANTLTVKVSAGMLGGSLTLVVKNRCFTTTPVTKEITTTTLPAAPTAITGSTAVCVGSQVTYRTAAIAGADSYVWSLPADWTVVSGQGEREITVLVGKISGDVTVAAVNVCGTTGAVTIAVQVNDIPVAPAAITGTATVCAGTEATYSVAAVPGATGYTWTPPASWSIIRGGGTAEITYRVGQAGGDLTVTATNSCGNSPVKTMAVNVNAKPAAPGAITGPSAVCASGTGNVYSIAAVNGATTYEWDVPQDWVIAEGQGSTTITVTAGAAAGTVKVKAGNDCGFSAESTYNSTINPLPATPAAITGTTTVCAGTEATYSIAAVPGATGYTWTLPAGWSIVSGEGTASVTVKAGQAGGNVSVTADNNCGGSVARTLAVTVIDKLAAPVISESSGACIGERITYSVPAVTGATGYAWTVPATWTLVSGQNDRSVVVEVGAGEGQVTVAVVNECGTGNAATLNVAPVLAPIETNTILGNASVCEYGETVTYTLATVEESAAYTWVVPGGWTIVSGQGTGTITVNTTATAGAISVSAKNSCGTAQTISKDVSVTVPPVAPATIIDKSNVCGGLAYTVDAVQGATGYTWTVPAGFTITSGQGTTTITVKADPNAVGEVTVAALNGNCSSVAASAKIDVSLADGQLDFPKAFSPNGDGKNDTWWITNLEKYPANEVTIFNRWGSEVYKARNYQNNWSASKLEKGTYFYKVRVTVCEGVVKEFTGYTTLFR